MRTWRLKTQPHTLWEGRFRSSLIRSERYLLACYRYVELNPVRAGLVRRPASWKWSSAGAHLNGEDDKLVRVAPLLEAVGDWKSFLAAGLRDDDLEAIRKHEKTGRPLGGNDFLDRLERTLGRGALLSARGLSLRLREHRRRAGALGPVERLA